MKVAFDHFQAHLMDLVIASLLMLVGAVTVIGAGLGVVAGVMYWRHATADEWRALAKPRPVLTSLALTLAAYAGVAIGWLDLRLVATLPATARMVIAGLVIAVGFVGGCMILQLLWQVAAGTRIDRHELALAFYLSFAWLPKWLGVAAVIAVGVGLMWAWPWLCVLVVGAQSWWLNRTLSRGWAQLRR